MRIRFTIRDLLWLTLVVAMGVGWWLDHKRLSNHITPFPPGVQPYIITGGFSGPGFVDPTPEERAKMDEDAERAIQKAADKPAVQ